MNKADRTDRIRALSKLALGIVRRCGDRCTVDRASGRYRLSEVRYNEFRMTLSVPIGDNNRASTLDVRFAGKNVLLVEWMPEAVTRTSYSPGPWELALMKYDRTPALASRSGACLSGHTLSC